MGLPTLVSGRPPKNDPQMHTEQPRLPSYLLTLLSKWAAPPIQKAISTEMYPEKDSVTELSILNTFKF